MSPQAQKALEALLAILGGIAVGLVFHFVLSSMLNFPRRLALSIAMIIGGAQYFALRYWLVIRRKRK